MSTSTTPAPATSPPHASVPPALEPYTITMSTFFTQNPHIDCLAVGAVVHHKQRLLLIQRSATDRAFPNFWEIPGGGCEASDATILHGVARELCEETGLKATRFVKLIAQLEWEDERPGKRAQRWAKVSVEVEVEGEEGEEGELVVRLDPEEHQGFIWATEEVVAEKERSGTLLGIYRPR